MQVSCPEQLSNVCRLCYHFTVSLSSQSLIRCIGLHTVKQIEGKIMQKLKKYNTFFAQTLAKYLVARNEFQLKFFKHQTS